MVIYLIGPSGSGKDTQATLLAKKLDLHHFSTGAVMRKLSAEGHPIAAKAQEYADRGEWAPDELVVEMMQEYIKVNCPDGFIVTGFPRMIKQMKMMDEVLELLKLDLAAVVHIDLDDEIALQRMKLQAEEAAAAGNPRPDATAELMRNRLKSYHDTIDPVIAEAEARQKLHHIDGNQTVDEVQEDIVRVLGV